MAGTVEVRQFQATCAPGVTAVAPSITSFLMPPRTVLRVRVRIPPGPNGVMGFAIGSAGNPIIPTIKGTYIVASDEIYDWELPGQIDSGGWEAQMYNSGIFPHTIYVVFVVQLPDLPVVGASLIQPNDTLSAT